MSPSYIALYAAFFLGLASQVVLVRFVENIYLVEYFFLLSLLGIFQFTLHSTMGDRYLRNPVSETGGAEQNRVKNEFKILIPLTIFINFVFFFVTVTQTKPII